MRKRSGILLMLGLAGIVLYARLGRESRPAVRHVAAPGEAVVRLYSAPIPYTLGLATHSWFVTREANQAHWNRWEIWQDAENGQHLRKNLMDPEEGVGAGGVQLVAETSGPGAQRVLKQIEESQTQYRCRDHYFILGPNSNTYPQWVLDRSGWGVKLPATAIGKGRTALCKEQPSLRREQAQGR